MVYFQGTCNRFRFDDHLTRTCPVIRAALFRRIFNPDFMFFMFFFFLLFFFCGRNGSLCCSLTIKPNTKLVEKYILIHNKNCSQNLNPLNTEVQLFWPLWKPLFVYWFLIGFELAYSVTAVL